MAGVHAVQEGLFTCIRIMGKTEQRCRMIGVGRFFANWGVGCRVGLLTVRMGGFEDGEDGGESFASHLRL